MFINLKESDQAHLEVKSIFMEMKDVCSWWLREHHNTTELPTTTLVGHFKNTLKSSLKYSWKEILLIRIYGDTIMEL